MIELRANTYNGPKALYTVVFADPVRSRTSHFAYASVRRKCRFNCPCQRRSAARRFAPSELFDSLSVGCFAL